MKTEQQGPPLGDVPDRDAPVVRVFERAAADAGERAFIVSDDSPDEACTFSEFLVQSRAVGRALVAAGIRPDDRVAVYSENRPRWCVAYAGVLFAGGIVVPLDAQMTVAGLSSVLADSGARLAFASEDLGPRLAEATADAQDLRRVLLDDPHSGEAEPGEAEPGEAEPGDPEPGEADSATAWSAFLAAGEQAAPELPETQGGPRPAAILYTSGTTGDPKGVILTHRNLQVELVAAREAVGFRDDDALLMFLPLQHVLAQVGSFLLAAAARVRVVHAVIRGGDELLTVLRDQGITVLLAVPLLFHLIHERIRARIAGLSWLARTFVRGGMAFNGWLREAFGGNVGPVLFASVHRTLGSRLRLLVSGGAPLDPAVQRDFLALGFAMTQAYGLTEGTGGSTFTPPDAIAVGTVGLPVPGTTIRIHEPDAEGIGEVSIQAEAVTPGYHGRPEATGELLTDGWLRTGDLGTIDDAGNLSITGRQKDVIVLGSGKNVYPEELEAHYAHAPHVAELCILGRSGRGTDASEKLHAVVVPDWDALSRDGLTSVRDTVEFELDQLSLDVPTYQRIMSFELRREPLPRTATRKVQRFLVKAGEGDETRDREEPGDDPRLQSGVGRRVEELLRERTGDEAPIHGDSHLELDLGIDSLNRAELFLAIESAFGMRIPEEGRAARTVADVIELVEERAAEPVRGPTVPLAQSWSDVVAGASPEDLPPAIRKRRGAISWTFLALLVIKARFVAWVLFRLRATGLENVPESGPFLVCPNHVSFLDGFVVCAALPLRVLAHAMVLGEADYVAPGLVGAIARFAGVVPTNPNAHLDQSMRAAAAGLKSGRMRVIFPEGTRSKDGTLKELKLGSAVLATELRLPIVPAVVEGAYEAWPRGAPRPKLHPVTIHFGPPVDAGAVADGAIAGGGSPAEAHQAVKEALRRALVELGAPVEAPPRD